MIVLNKAAKSLGASETLRINIDHIIAVQRQTNTENLGARFTAVIILGAPAFDARESEEQIEELIYAARKKRNEMNYKGVIV